LVVTYLVVNDWKMSEIVNAFQLDHSELAVLLTKLDRLRIIDYRPPVRIKKLTGRNFEWRKDGPVHAYFIERVCPEFFKSHFETAGDEFRFVAGMLSEAWSGPMTVNSVGVPAKMLRARPASAGPSPATRSAG